MFCELLAKTNYSFLEGASHPEEMVATARGLGYPTLGITDRLSLSGLPKAFSFAKQQGFPLCTGAELQIEDLTCHLLAKTRKGYGNLCEILTAFVQEGPCWEVLLAKAEDLILFLLPAEHWPLSQLYPRFLEIYWVATHFLDGKKAYSALEALSRETQIPCMASNLPLLHTRARKPLLDALTCIRHTCTLNEAGFRLQPNSERTLKSEREMEQLFPHHLEWVHQSGKIAATCTFSLQELKYRYPSEWIPSGETSDSFLRKLSWEGAKTVYHNQIPEAFAQQLEHELALIEKLGYSDYFLTIWDVLQFAKREKILFQGRGSAVNSVVCFVLGFTAIDPLRLNLLFERFLSQERQEPPDIDIDFEHERREEVIQYIFQRYGRHRAAIAAEVICFRKRSALRELAKVFGIPQTAVEKWIPRLHRKKLSAFSAEALQMDLPHFSQQKLRQYWKLCQELLGFPRHLGTHVGGFVLCQDTLSRNVPIQKAAMPGRTILQWDKYDLDSVGFVKVDILGLGILTCLRKCFQEIEKTYHQTLSLYRIPPEDPKVYAQLQKADTVGVFQIESRAQMNMLPRLKPEQFYDLVVEVSLVRPGPIQGDMVHPYLRRRTGREAVEYPHPKLRKILEKTYGVPLFQEQIMRIAMEVADFTPGEADALRRAMGSWKKNEENGLAKLGDRFRKGLLKKGLSQEFAERIFHQIQGFAEYGFPESHAASFALLAYASAYLRFYYPDAYLVAILNSQPMGFYRIHTLVQDGIRHGVRVLGVDIQTSCWENVLAAPREVRLGFREIHGLSQKVGNRIEKARRNRPFSSLSDFAFRLKAEGALPKRELFFLAAANAFDSLGISRREAFWQIQGLDLQDGLVPEDNPLPLRSETPMEKVSQDYHAQGLSLFCHPVALYRKQLQQLQSTPSSHLRKPTSKICVGGMVISRQMPPTAKGVLFITLEDEFGFINLVIWKNIFEKFSTLLITESFLICWGQVQKAQDGEVFHVLVERAAPLATPVPTLSRDFH